MKATMLRSLVLGAIFTALSVTASSQLTVDATGPIRGRQRNADVGHGGGVGRKVPLLVIVQLLGAPLDAKGRTEIEFVLTNAGRDDLIIPISPHPGDLEPSDPKASYTVKCLSLFITHAKTPGILAGGAILYGSQEVPETLTTLTPGSSIRVLARVALSPNSPAESRTIMFVASVSLTNETIKMINGRRESDLQEIGSANSKEFTLQSLFMTPN